MSVRTSICSPVCVTGLGAVTPLGRSAAETWRALLEPEGAGPVFVPVPLARFDLGGMACVKAGLVERSPFPGSPLPQSHAADMAFAAAAQAVGHELSGFSTFRRTTGVITASNFGLIECAQPALAEGVARPAGAWHYFRHDTAAHLVAEHFRFGGPCAALSLSCASGTAAVARAAAMIHRGEARRMLVVAYDSISLYAWSGLCALRTMTREPPPRPFDAERSGTLFSEGAAALLLESPAEAEARGAVPVGMVRAWASGNNAFHLTALPARAAGTAEVVRRVLAYGGVAPGEVDYYNAHATATVPNDLTEFQALEDVLSPEGARRVPVAAHKGALGHMLGAAGAAETLLALFALRDGVVPGTPQRTTPDPAIPVNLPAAPLRARLRHALKTSAGFGGCNTALLLSPP